MARYVEGPYIVEDQADGSRKVVGYAPQAQANTVVTKRADPYARPKAANEAAASEFDPEIKSTQLQNAQYQQPNTIFSQKDKLRSDYNAMPVVKAYRVAIQQLAQALGTGEGAQSDLALTYAFAKAMDPESVVRESEQGMVASSQPWLQASAERIKKEFGMDGAGNFTPEARKALRAQIINSVKTRVKGYNQIRDQFSDIAKRSNFDPAEIVGKHDADPFVPQFKAYDAQFNTPKNQEIAAQVSEGRAFANDSTVTKTGNNGFDKYVTDQDRQRAETLQSAYESGASADKLNKVAQGMGLDAFSPSDLNLLMGERAKGNRVRIAPFATGTRSLSQQVLGAVADTPLGAYGGAALDAATLGFSDELVGAAMGERAGQLAQYGKEYSRQQSPVASFLGDITGGVALGGPLTSGVRLAGIKGAQAASPFVSKMTQAAAGSLPRAAVSAATLQGALTGAGQMNDNRLLGAAVGGGAGLAGGYVGSKLFGAGANAAMSGPATGGGNRVRGLFGGRQRPQIPAVDKPSQMVNATIGGDMDQILGRLTQAEELGVPMTLADQPQLTSLAGATVRRSPTAKTMADEIMEPRARGQYDRLIGAVERDLGPIANVPQLSDDLIKQARAQSEPLYRQAFEAPGASSVDVSGIVKTPMGNLAMQKAVGRVQNKLGPDGQPMDPSSLGFNIGAGNEVTLGQTPSFETLNYMKRGLDDIIEGGFDPIARSYTPEAQAATALKQNLVNQMDAVNPAYKQARSVYAGKAQERGALQQGQSALSMTPDTMNFQRQALSPSQQAQYGLGYRSAMSEQAGKARYSSNPFETAYGTPQAQQKIAILFPEGAERFGQQYDLERLLAKSKNEITGNSMTAARQNADADFAPGMLQAGMVDVATTGTPLVSGGRLLAKIGGDELGRIGAKRKAEALAPILFDADPAKNAAVLRELQKNIKVQKRAKGMFGGKSRALGAVSGGAPSVGFTLGLSE